jgi:hypothetical protein
MPFSFLQKKKKKKKKKKKTLKEEFGFTNYDMQVANSELPICLVLNAYFLPSCSRGVISDIVEILGEHSHTQVEMCGQLIMQLALHEN